MQIYKIILNLSISLPTFICRYIAGFLLLSVNTFNYMFIKLHVSDVLVIGHPVLAASYSNSYKPMACIGKTCTPIFYT